MLLSSYPFHVGPGKEGLCEAQRSVSNSSGSGKKPILWFGSGHCAQVGQLIIFFVYNFGIG